MSSLTMAKTNNIKEALKKILDAINLSSEGIFDFVLGTQSGAGGDTVSIIDRNLSIIEIASTDNSNDYLDNLFTFHPHSPNSIVKNFDLNYTTPSAGIQNMIAIQSLNPGEKMFPVSSFVAQSIAEKFLTSANEKRRASNNSDYSVDDIGIRYLPVRDRYKINKSILQLFYIRVNYDKITVKFPKLPKHVDS